MKAGKEIHVKKNSIKTSKDKKKSETNITNIATTNQTKKKKKKRKKYKNCGGSKELLHISVGAAFYSSKICGY